MSTFDTFVSSGEDDTNIYTEIQQELTDAIIDAVSTRPFNRSFGAGLEMVENESLSVINELIYKARIIEGIGLYNLSVVPDKQVVTSQEYISFIKDDVGGVITISIYYLPQRDINISSPTYKELQIQTGVQ